MSFRVFLRPEQIETCLVQEVRDGKRLGYQRHARLGADLPQILAACDMKHTDYLGVFYCYDGILSQRNSFDFALRPPLAGRYGIESPSTVGGKFDASYKANGDGYYQQVGKLTDPEWQFMGYSRVWMTLYSKTKAAILKVPL